MAGEGRVAGDDRVAEGTHRTGGRGGRDDGDAGCPPDAPVADEPRTPRRIALAAASTDAGLEFLLGDFRDAYAAYSHLAGCALPEFERVRPGADAGVVSKAADGIVFAFDGGLDAGRLDALARLMGPGARLHAIIDLPGLDPGAADGAARSLRELCRQRGALWCGGVAFAGGRPFDVLRSSPRMGLLRRPFAESMDMLVGSARMGCSIRRSQELGGADVRDFDELGLVRATPLLPPRAWSIVIKMLGRRLHRR